MPTTPAPELPDPLRADCEIQLLWVRPGDPTSNVIAHCQTHTWTSNPKPGRDSARRSAAGHKRAMKLRASREGDTS